MISDHCPEGWTREGVSCYYATPEKLSFDHAVNRCHQIEGILAEPKTSLQNENLVKFIRSRPFLKYSSGFWIGISDQMSENKFVYKSSNLDLIFSKFNSGQPDDWQQNEDCMELRTDWNDNWNDEACSSLRNFICEKGANLCPPGWTLIGNQCLITPDEKVVHDQAGPRCQELKGQLVTPKDWEENNLIVYFLKGQDHKKGENRFWLGITDKDQESSFVYEATGQKAMFIPWAIQPWKQPDNFNNEDCLELRLDMDNHWNDDNCNLVQSFVCQRPALACPENWTASGGKCHQVPTEKANFQQAAKKCQRLGGQLAEPKSQLENEALIQLVQLESPGDQKFWYGINDIERENEFRYLSSGERITFALWNPGQPNAYRGANEDCVELRLDWEGGTWNDLPCQYERKFICERPME